MTDTTFIFKIAASILVPETDKKPVRTFIYSAKEIDNFYHGAVNTFRPLYGKFNIANDNEANEYYTPPYHIG